jgi:hypothetical protein
MFSRCGGLVAAQAQEPFQTSDFLRLPFDYVLQLGDLFFQSVKIGAH